MAIPKKGTAPAGRKSMKMEADELTEKIKACVKEALDEQAEAKAEGEEGTEDAVAEVAPADISGLIEDAMAVVAEKRKSRKEAGEELGDVTAEEVMEAVGEIIDATEGEAKEDDGVEEEVKEDEEVTDEAKGRKAATRKHQTKSARKSAASPRPAEVQLHLHEPYHPHQHRQEVHPARRSARPRYQVPGRLRQA